jgi:hypothetical protein
MNRQRRILFEYEQNDSKPTWYGIEKQTSNPGGYLPIQ